MFVREFDQFQECIDGLRATSDDCIDDKIPVDGTESMEVKLEHLHHSIDIKEEDAFLQYQQDTNEVENNNIEPPVALEPAPDDNNLHWKDAGQQSLQTYNVIYPASQDQTILQPMGSVIPEIVPPEVTANIDNKKLDTIMATLEMVLENQDKIMKQLSNFQVRFEMAMKRRNVDNTATTSSGQYKRISPLQPIDCLEDFKKLEDKLKDTEIFNDYVDSLSFICGRDTNTKGIDHSYILVDKFFTRKFFTLCSWAGGSKVRNTKFAFKFYENVIALFFKLVHLADPKFTLKDCEDFFKSAIRNSVRRNHATNTRTSRSKKRPKKLSYNARAAVPVTNGDNAESCNEDEDCEVTL